MTDTLDLEVDGPDVECNFKGASDFKGGCSWDTSDFNGGRFEDRSEDRSGFEVGFSDDTTDDLNGGKFEDGSESDAGSGEGASDEEGGTLEDFDVTSDGGARLQDPGSGLEAIFVHVEAAFECLGSLLLDS